MLKASIIGFYNMSENTWEIVEKLSKWGYKAFENGEFLLTGDVEKNKAKLETYGMSVLSVNADLHSLECKLSDVISTAKKIGVKYVCCYWSDPQTYEQALGTAKLLDIAGKELISEGLCLCYHCHDHEFRKSFNGIRYFDILLANTSPENLSVNLDVGWASVARENVPKLIRGLGTRIKLMHFKDFYDLDNRNSFTALGTGKVDIQTLIAEADKIGVTYISVEQDTLHNLNCDDTVLLSYLTLKESGLVE